MKKINTKNKLIKYVDFIKKGPYIIDCNNKLHKKMKGANILTRFILYMYNRRSKQWEQVGTAPTHFKALHLISNWVFKRTEVNIVNFTTGQNTHYKNGIKISLGASDLPKTSYWGKL